MLSGTFTKDDTLRFACDQAPESVDPFFNSVRIGVIIGASSRVLNMMCFLSQFGCTDDGAPTYPYC